VEQKKPRTRRQGFADHFTGLLHDHWSDILSIISQHSPRLAALLRNALPVGLQRSNNSWRIQILVGREVREKLRQTRDNEIVAQAVRLYYHRAAQLKLPHITIEFEA
jgi:hypothetical protein